MGILTLEKIAVTYLITGGGGVPFYFPHYNMYGTTVGQWNGPAGGETTGERRDDHLQ